MPFVQSRKFALKLGFGHLHIIRLVKPNLFFLSLRHFSHLYETALKTYAIFFVLGHFL